VAGSTETDRSLEKGSDVVQSISALLHSPVRQPSHDDYEEESKEVKTSKESEYSIGNALKSTLSKTPPQQTSGKLEGN
jgi:hypothetical protein